MRAENNEGTYSPQPVLNVFLYSYEVDRDLNSSSDESNYAAVDNQDNNNRSNNNDIEESQSTIAEHDEEAERAGVC